MKTKLLFLASIIAVSAVSGAAQIKIEVKPAPQQQTANIDADTEDTDIVHQVFSPITDRLNLTAEQKSRITSIATTTMLLADPLFQQLDELDDQLSAAAFTGRLDESQIRQLSEKQGTVLSQIISMKARAKMSFYRILTAEQRALVAEEYRTRGTEANLGSISN
jgi:Spy/CpxP family protein refolding chaperone